MKNLLLILLLTTQASPLNAYAEECDFSTGIKKTEDGYVYTTDCHKRVGKLVADSKDREDQVNKLNKTIELKDMALDLQEKRAQLWMDTSFKLEDRVNTIEKVNDSSKWLYFGLGVIFTGASVWAAGQLR